MEKTWDSQSIPCYRSVEHIKKRLRKGNTNYLGEHPEIRAILRVFLHQVINKRPDNIYEFGAELFNCNNLRMLVTMINQQLKRVNELLQKGQYSKYDGVMLFSPRESSHSLLSKSSISENVDALMRYAMVLKDPEQCNN